MAKKSMVSQVLFLSIAPFVMPKTRSLLQNSTGHRGPQAFDVNTRATPWGTPWPGIGHTHLSPITSTVDAPSMSHMTFKTRQREIGHALEKVARDRCSEYIQAEKENVWK